MLVSGNQVQVAAYQLDLTPAKIRQEIKEGIQISQLRQESPEQLIVGISFLITDVNNYMNVKRSLNSAQIAGLAVKIARNWWYLKLSELMYVFERAKSGAYGSNYETLSTEKIEGWILEYDTTERLDLLEQTRNESPEARSKEEDEAFYKAYNENREAGYSFVNEQAEKQRETQENARRDANASFPALVASETNSKRVQRLYQEFFTTNPKASEEDFWNYERQQRINQNA